ncbi:MAG: hypothetical protein AAGA31_16235, partial [Bacteroidota bacterium]
MKNDRVDIMYLASHGFAARMLFQTGLLAKLSTLGYRVMVVVPDASDRNLAEICAKENIELLELPGETSFRFVQTMQFRKYFLTDLEANPVVMGKHMQRVLASERSFLRRLVVTLAWYIYKLVKLIPTLRLLYRKLEGHLLHSDRIEQALAKKNPKLLVATYPVFSPECQLLAGAEKLGIPSALQLLSWDNVTGKETFHALADDYIVWGEVMANELREVYQVPADRIYRCGVPHFDLHYKVSSALDTQDYPNPQNIDFTKPYLFFGMSAPRFCPREIDIVEWLAERIQKNVFGPDVQLVVRPHPQNMVGDMVDSSWVGRLEQLAGLDRVTVNYPKLVGGSKIPWSMEQGDMLVFSSLIARSSVVLNSGSTVSIDALMHYRPVVMTLFDANEELPYWQSARRMKDFIHLKKL